MSAPSLVAFHKVIIRPKVVKYKPFLIVSVERVNAGWSAPVLLTVCMQQNLVEVLYPSWFLWISSKLILKAICRESSGSVGECLSKTH